MRQTFLLPSRTFFTFINIKVGLHLYDTKQGKYGNLLYEVISMITQNNEKKQTYFLHVTQPAILRSSKINKNIIESARFRRQSLFYSNIQRPDNDFPTMSGNCLRN